MKRNDVLAVALELGGQAIEKRHPRVTEGLDLRQNAHHRGVRHLNRRFQGSETDIQNNTRNG